MPPSSARSGGPAPPLANHSRTYTPHEGRSGSKGSVANNTSATRGHCPGDRPRPNPRGQPSPTPTSPDEPTSPRPPRGIPLVRGLTRAGAHFQRRFAGTPADGTRGGTGPHAVI